MPYKAIGNDSSEPSFIDYPIPTDAAMSDPTEALTLLYGPPLRGTYGNLKIDVKAPALIDMIGPNSLLGKSVSFNSGSIKAMYLNTTVAFPASVNTLNLPELEVALLAGGNAPLSGANLTTVNAPKLKFATLWLQGWVKYTAPLLTNLHRITFNAGAAFVWDVADLPVFIDVGVGGITIGTSTSAVIDALTNCAGPLIISSNANLTSISLPKLQRIRGLNVASSTPLFTTINAPNLTFVGVHGWIVSTVSGYTTLPASIKEIVGNVGFFNVMTQAQVDAVLAKLVSLNGTGGTALYTGTDKVVTLNGPGSAAPSAAGLANKAILVGRGITVNTI